MHFDVHKGVTMYVADNAGMCDDVCCKPLMKLLLYRPLCDDDTWCA